MKRANVPGYPFIDIKVLKKSLSCEIKKSNKKYAKTEFHTSDYLFNVNFFRKKNINGI